MFISSCEQEGVFTALPVPAGDYVCCDLCVGVTNVRSIVDVENRSGHVEGLGHFDILGFLAQCPLVNDAL